MEQIIKFCKLNKEKEFISKINNVVFTLWPYNELSKLNEAYEVNNFIPACFALLLAPSVNLPDVTNTA